MPETRQGTFCTLPMSRCRLFWHAATYEMMFFKPTSLLLVHGHLVPVHFHAIPESHPQIGLLLRRHSLPPLLNVGESRVGDGVRRGASLLLLLTGDGLADARGGRGGSREATERETEGHGGRAGGWWGWKERRRMWSWGGWRDKGPTEGYEGGQWRGWVFRGRVVMYEHRFRH